MFRRPEREKEILSATVVGGPVSSNKPNNNMRISFMVLVQITSFL